MPIRASSPSSTSSSEVSSDEESDASGDGPSIPSPIQLELREISLRVKCLMKLSVVLRQPVPRDRTAKYAQIPMDHWKPFDQDHVRNKLSQIACTMAHDLLPSPDEAPNANPGSKFYKFEAPEFLIERLGTANTRRRQFLQYLKEHHDKITKYVDAPVSRKEGDIEEGFETKTNCDTDKYTFGLTMDTQTSVTTVPHAINLNPVAADDVISESGQTGTSYATSVAHPDEGYLLKVPPLPKPAGSFEDTFECPYCFYFLNVKSQRAWKLVFDTTMHYVHN